MNPITADKDEHSRFNYDRILYRLKFPGQIVFLFHIVGRDDSPRWGMRGIRECVSRKGYCKHDADLAARAWFKCATGGDR